uniref:Uncharacterized protein n=1 Tax=Aegilops tauschii subsp. strangulata TaxID=200361 RepID=A0A452YKF8_AEGTS
EGKKEGTASHDRLEPKHTKRGPRPRASYGKGRLRLPSSLTG